MNKVDAEVDYLDENFDAAVEELEKLSEVDTIKIEINEGLEEALKELDSLHEQFSQEDSARLLDLCKTTVIETITGQFGIAGMFIQCQDGGNSTTPLNFKKGIVSEDNTFTPNKWPSDAERYSGYVENNNGSKRWKQIRNEVGYDGGNKALKRAAVPDTGIVIDAYTGKPIPKSEAALDHIVSAKEIESNHVNHLYKTPEERAKIATSDENLAWTKSNANDSKGKLKMKDWLDKENPEGERTNADRYGIDKKMALKEDKDARNYVRKEITVAALKKHSSELLLTGGRDAANMAAYSALGVVLRDLTQAIFEEIKTTFKERGNETLKEIFLRFKDRIGVVIADLKAKWKDIFAGSLEAGVTSFLSNIVIFIINLFATTLKKIVSMIRAGFVSLCQAIKMLAHPPLGMDREEANYQALKILTAGLIGAASLGLSAAIEKILQAIPGLQPLMMFPIPSIGREPRTVSDILAVTLSALAGGILTTIVLYFMDKCRQAGKKDKLQIRLVAQSGVAVQYKIAQTWCVMDDAYKFLNYTAQKVLDVSIETKNSIDQENENTRQSINDFGNTLEKLRRRREQRKNNTEKGC